MLLAVVKPPNYKIDIEYNYDNGDIIGDDITKKKMKGYLLKNYDWL